MSDFSYQPNIAIPIAQFDPAAFSRDSKTRCQLVVDRLPDGQPLNFPTLVVRGAQSGQTMLATGCVHGDEYEGIIAIQDVFEELDPAQMSGTLIAIPVLNTPAFSAGTREGGWDHQNLARIFPGDAGGSLSERIAAAFQRFVLPRADFYTDIHSGGNPIRIHRLAGYSLSTESITRVQREAAIAYGLPLVWGTSPLPGRSLSAAADCGVPAIYIEHSGEGRCSAEDRELAVRGIKNVLAYLQVISGGYPTEARDLIEDDAEQSGHLQVGYPSPTSGLFLPGVSVWEQVEEGQVVGEIRHVDGTKLTVITAKTAGRVLMVRTAPRVFSGDPLLYIVNPA